MPGSSTRPPLPPPFPVGARLRYIGDREVRAGDGPDAPLIIGRGLEVEIVRVEPGRCGTGVQLVDSDGPMFNGDGDPIIDETQDGYSAYEIEGERKRGRIIWPGGAGEWEPVYGPYKVGDFVEEGAGFYGIVVGAGPKKFRVQWTNTTRNEYRQDYRAVQRARWFGPADEDERIRAALRAEVRAWSVR